jgi:hypothetical protein
MRVGSPLTWLCLVLLAGSGCQQLESLRQGPLASSYNKELRDLAGDLQRQQANTIVAEERARPVAEDNGVTPAGSWHNASLSDAVQLRPPEPLQLPHQ